MRAARSDDTEQGLKVKVKVKEVAVRRNSDWTLSGTSNLDVTYFKKTINRGDTDEPKAGTWVDDT